MAVRKTSRGKKAKEPEKAASNYVPAYDMESTQRYVDSISQKTEFDRVLDELKMIAAEKLSWDVLSMTQKHFGASEEDNARKLEAFLGAVILSAATELFDKGYEDAAFRQLEQAKAVLNARRKLRKETEALCAKTEENAIDIADMLGLDLGDGYGED